MPYNTAAIPQTEEITGTAQLPLARVKKILAVDDDISGVSATASFGLTIAAEMFIRYYAQQAMNVVKSEKKPRRNIQYKDFANAVSRIDNLNFLEDIVPKTTTYKEHKARKAKAQEAEAATTNGHAVEATAAPSNDATVGAAAVSSINGTLMGEPVPADPHHPDSHAAQSQAAPPHPRLPNGQQSIFQHYAPVGSTAQHEPADVEMG